MIRKLAENETRAVSIFVPFIMMLSFIFLVVIWGWFRGFVVGGVNSIVLIVQMVFISTVFFLSNYLILKYAGEKNLSKESYLLTRQRN